MIGLINRSGRLIITIGLIIAVILIVIFLNEILFPFLLAGFLAYVLSPVIDKINKWKINKKKLPRGLAIIIVYFLILFSLISGGIYLVPKVTLEIGRLIEEFPEAVTTLTQQWIPKINKKINELVSLFPEIENIEPDKKEKISVKNENNIKNEKTNDLENLIEKYTFEIKEFEEGHIEIIPKKKIVKRC